ncbi:MAG: 2Fe-2S iron-sulfur cluster-binding protein, partial [Candidatus Sumerlaeota bacterium]
MPKHELTITFEPADKTVKVAPETALSDALVKAEIDFAYPCAGAKMCGRCRVHFDEGAPPPTSEEKRLLAFKDIEAGMRLACCSILTDNATVRLPDTEAGGHTEHILTEGVQSDLVVDPEVTICACQLPPSTLENPLADWVRIRQALPEDMRLQARPTLSVLQKLPSVIECAEGDDGNVTLTLRESRVIEVECGDKSKDFYGVALDLGTTTLSAALVDMRTGSELCVGGRLNPQRAFGHDLISRIHAIQENLENLDTLHERVIEAIGLLIEEMCEKQGINPDDISAMAVAGNTVMEHLFLRIDPRPLGRAPFAGTLRTGVRLEARDLKLPIHPCAPVYVLPCMGGFVGGDITAGVLVTRLSDLKGVNVLVDIGTNGEVVVARDGQLQ